MKGLDISDKDGCVFFCGRCQCYLLSFPFTGARERESENKSAAHLQPRWNNNNLSWGFCRVVCVCVCAYAVASAVAGAAAEAAPPAVACA